MEAIHVDAEDLTAVGEAKADAWEYAMVSRAEKFTLVDEAEAGMKEHVYRSRGYRGSTWHPTRAAP